MKRILLAASLAALVSGAVAALATVVVPNPQNCQIPGACIDLGQVASQIPGISFTMQTGAVTALPAGTGNFYQVPRSVTVDNIIGSNYGTLTCSASAVLALQNCGASTSCASPTTIGSVTLATATNSTAVQGTVTAANALVAAGSYLAWTISSGTCTVASLAGTAVAH